MAGYRPKKRLGQNFLIADNIIQKIIDLIEPSDSMPVIEIGAGRGALTLPLARSGARIIAVEIDNDLIGYLERLLGEYSNVSILNQDFLDLDPGSCGMEPFILAGNLPYHISSPVLDWVVKYRSFIHKACLMMQKEVADRLASRPGSRNWSPLAVFSQLYFDVELCFTVKRDSFRPPPKVTSAVVRLITRRAIDVGDPKRFERLVRTAFTQRRKLLVNNLAGGLIPDATTVRSALRDMKLEENIRAEQVSIEQFIELTRRLIPFMSDQTP